jgi:hypothetical protein
MPPLTAQQKADKKRLARQQKRERKERRKREKDQVNAGRNRTGEYRRNADIARICQPVTYSVT